jgi:ABC-type amino acid transport substrate-binding protein
MIRTLPMALPALALLALAACDPRQTTDTLGRRTAETVVKPIVDDTMTEPQAAGVTRCIVANADAAEVQALVRDVGTFAGTSTVATVRRIAERPETRSCIAGAGLPAPVF